MAKNKVAYDVAVAALIKENKPKGSIFIDDLTDQLATPYELNSNSMDKLIQKVEDAGISVVDENGEPSERSLKKEAKNEGKPPPNRLRSVLAGRTFLGRPFASPCWSLSVPLSDSRLAFVVAVVGFYSFLICHFW